MYSVAPSLSTECSHGFERASSARSSTARRRAGSRLAVGADRWAARDRARPRAASSSNRAAPRGPRPGASSAARPRSRRTGSPAREAETARPAGTTRRAPRARGSGSRSTSRRRSTWCMVTMAMCSRSLSRSSAGTDERSARQVERPLGFFANAVLGVRARARPREGRSGRRTASGNSSAGGDDLARDRRRRRPAWSATPRVGARPR